MEVKLLNEKDAYSRRREEQGENWNRANEGGAWWMRIGKDGKSWRMVGYKGVTERRTERMGCRRKSGQGRVLVTRKQVSAVGVVRSLISV